MSSGLVKTLSNPKTEHLVFTSAGDKSNLYCWLNGNRNFDLWVNYYGNQLNRYKDESDFYTVRKGGKFPNLHFVYRNWASILNQYQAILVMDDDVIIDGPSINRLFDIRRKYNLWLLQPAFNPKGKISHRITRVNPWTFLRYTNFVEMTCPLFQKDKLEAFMNVYDPALVGYGVDYWYMHFLGPEIVGKVAIVDEISCINPRDHTKGGKREIDLLKSTPERIRIWDSIKEQNHISERKHKEFESIRRSLNLSSLVDAINLVTNLVTPDTFLKKILKIKKRFISR